MKPVISLPVLLLFQIFILRAETGTLPLPPTTAETKGTLTRESRFDSLSAFVTAVKAFEPAQSNGYLAYQFAAVELGQPEDESTGRVVRPTSVQSCVILWNNEDTALIFAIARPSTEATRSSVGVLFLVLSYDKKWRIADCKKFIATGKYAFVDAKLTAGADSDRAIGPEGVVVTVTESQGGSGLSYQISSSYRISDGSLVRADLE